LLTSPCLEDETAYENIGLAELGIHLTPHPSCLTLDN